jgi:hypothetical protein
MRTTPLASEFQRGCRPVPGEPRQLSGHRRRYGCGSLPLASLVILALLTGCHDGSTGNGSTGNGGNGNGGGGNNPPAAVAPTITAQPADASATVGQAASFSVTASGTAPLSYQWQRNGVAVSGATSSTYSLSSTALADSGAQFTVTVSNSAGSATSNAAKLTVSVAGTLVSAATGGQVKSADGRVTLTIPPGGLTADSTVSISPAADWTIPAAIASEFKGIPGTTYAIVTQGGGFGPTKLLSITFSSATLSAPAAAGRQSIKSSARPADSGSGSNSDNLGLSQDCGSGNPVIVSVPPADGYDPGTYISGCPAGSGSTGEATQSNTTVSLSTWTPPSPPSTPSNNNLWENFTARSADTIGYQVNGTYYGAFTGGDTWMGPTQVSLSSNQVGLTPQTSLLTLVGSTGATIAQQDMSTTPAAVVLDGPGNFYAMFGPALTEFTYIARYQLQFSSSGAASFVQLWEYTFAGIPTSADGSHPDPLDNGINGVNFALDSTNGNLVALALPGYNGLTGDEMTRLGFAADGFLVRFDRSGALVWATPVTPVQPDAQLDPPAAIRVATYTLRLDSLGDAYVAGSEIVGGDCCAAGAPTPPFNITGLALEKIDGSGKLAWATAIASPDAIGESQTGVGYEYGRPYSELAVDGNNDVYLTYRRFTVPYDTDGGQSGRTSVVKTAAATGVVTPLGDVDPAFDAAGGELRNQFGSSYVDSDGKLYIFSFIGDNYVQLSALDSSLHVASTAKLLHFNPLNPDEAIPGMFQVDSSGHLFEQYAGQFQNASTPGVCGNVSAGVTCYGAYLREFHF